MNFEEIPYYCIDPSNEIYNLSISLFTLFKNEEL